MVYALKLIFAGTRWRVRISEMLLVAERGLKVSLFGTFICWRIVAVVRDLGGTSTLKVRSYLDIARAGNLVLQVGAGCECGVICRLSEMIHGMI